VIRWCIDTQWGKAYRYGDPCDGYITNQVLFLTTDARAIVVAASYPVTGSSTLDRHYEKMIYTTTKPWATAQGGLLTPGASSPERPQDHFVQFAISRAAQGLSTTPYPKPG
jgi:hypothetical protein